MSNEKEREKAKQKNIAVIENAIAARNKVRVFTAQKSSSIVSRFFLFLKISFFSLKSKGVHLNESIQKNRDYSNPYIQERIS